MQKTYSADASVDGQNRRSHITFQPSEIDGAVSSACFLIVLNHVRLPRRSGANAEGAGMDAVDPE